MELAKIDASVRISLAFAIIFSEKPNFHSVLFHSTAKVLKDTGRGMTHPKRRQASFHYMSPSNAHWYHNGSDTMSG